MKKAINSIFALMLAGVMATGCTDEVQVGNAFLDKAPGGTTNLDSIFANPDYVNQFLTNIYNKQYYGLPYNNTGKNQAASPYNGKLDALTDLYQMHWSSCKVWSSYYTGTFSAKEDPLMSFANDYVWETVHMVSVIKENIDRCEGLTDHEKKYIIAQAKALQAFAYWNLLPFYGGLPIVEKTINDANEKNENGTAIGERATFEETVDAIVRWCDEAIPDLYWAYDGNDAETSSAQTGRWTKAAVMALKAKVLWLAASPMYNNSTSYYGGNSDAEQKNLTWYGNYDQARWQRALNAFEDFWRENNGDGENGYYHLLQAQAKNLDGYRLAYRRGYMFDDSPESLHWTKVASIYGSQGAYSWLNWNTWSVNRSNNHPTVEYVEMFGWSDGKPFNRETDMKYSYSYPDPKDDQKTWDVYTCLSGSYDKLFYEYKEIRGGFSKTYKRDPRLYENATVTGTLQNLPLQSADGKASGNVMELWVGGQNAGQCVKHPSENTLMESMTSYCPTGFAAYKYVLNQIEWHRDPNMHWNVLTIPDMILMYAECLAECGRSADAVKQVDLVRARVGLKSIGNTSNNSFKLDLTNNGNKDQLIEEILRERACELGMENARYIDMVRRMRTDWMVKPLHGMATFRMIKNAQNQWVRRNAPWFGDDKDGGMAEPARFEYEFFELIQGTRLLWGKDPNSLEVKKWLMFPFPQDEVNKGYGLIQNPGW